MLPTFCDDGLVEAAVDEAITTYNKELVSGNQFARYQITEAKKSENGSETTYKVNFHVRESDCPVGGDKIWLECDYLPEGKAERIVAERAPCLGCPKEIPTNNTELMKALQHALKKFNNESNSPKLFVISVIKKATIQVVAGWKYNAHFEIQQSNCSKAEFVEITPECQPENSTVLLRMPPGMSPFRAIVLNVRKKKSSEESKEHVTQSPDSVPTDSKHASGEESQEQAAGSGPVTPDPTGPIGPVPGPVVINPDVTGEPVRLLELLGGPGPVDLHHLFHCPSKPWKSVNSHVVTHAPQPESVTDGPPTVVTEDKSKQSGTFSDADLLAVEAAVDEAITTYNKELVSGNQFARYQITEAKKSENGSETTYKVNFRVRESDCPVGGDKIWLECDYLPEGKAERIVAERAPCLGCPKEIPTNNTELMKALQHALKKFNNESNSPKLFVISVIKKATLQVVAGWKYNAHFEIQQSNCSKAEFVEITPECQPENSTVLLRMPPGMSPFRAIVLNVRKKKSSEESKEHVTQSPDSVPTDSKHASGEESQEQAAGSGPVTPDPTGPIGPVPGPVVINPDVTGEPVRLLELLGGPGPVDLHHLFHCPSKPWKSVNSHVVTHAPQPESVTDGPPTVVTEDKSKQSGTFSDADLLAGL
ncbi:UNVERIFIED_CONTAM: hypothetical protein FKN15_023489 [Acipenser sinensis]